MAPSGKSIKGEEWTPFFWWGLIDSDYLSLSHVAHEKSILSICEWTKFRLISPSGLLPLLRPAE